jgi:hypothetical protein
MVPVSMPQPLSADAGRLPRVADVLALAVLRPESFVFITSPVSGRPSCEGSFQVDDPASTPRSWICFKPFCEGSVPLFLLPLLLRFMLRSGGLRLLFAVRLLFPVGHAVCRYALPPCPDLPAGPVTASP